MKDTPLEKYKKQVHKKIEKLIPIFARAAIGDFSKKIQLLDDEDEDFAELYSGIQIMTEVIQEKMLAIEERNRKLETANISQSRLAAIVEHSGDPIISKNLNGIILSWNQGAQNVFGYTPDEIIGKHVTTFIPHRLQEEETMIINKIKQGESIVHFETYRLHKSGKEIQVSLTISPIKDSTGKIIGASKIARDISAQKIVEQHKEDFVGMVSHELKTPLTSLKMFTHILSQHLHDEADEKGAQYVWRIDEQLDRLTKLVIDFLDVTRVQQGKLEYQLSIFSMRKLIEEIKDDLHQASPSHEIIIEGKDVGKAYGDPDRIRQVLINLLTNAIKYSPKSKKIIVTIATNPTTKTLTVSVQDFGIGIALDQQKKIFNRFYQVHSPTSKTYPGLGLGLYICNEIITHNNGKLWVYSTGEKGATFFFNLPTRKNSNLNT